MPNEPQQIDRSLVVSTVEKIIRDNVDVRDWDAEIASAADEIVSYIEGLQDEGDEWERSQFNRDADICACGGTGWIPGANDYEFGDERCPYHGEDD